MNQKPPNKFQKVEEQLKGNPNSNQPAFNFTNCNVQFTDCFNNNKNEKSD
jgi:hypothetical protein